MTLNISFCSSESVRRAKKLSDIEIIHKSIVKVKEKLGQAWWLTAVI
jgi:hypothetical protein